MKCSSQSNCCHTVCWGVRRQLCCCSCCWESAAGADSGTWVPTRSTNDATTRKGFDNFYNLDYDKAIREFETALQAHPDDPFAVNHLLVGGDLQGTAAHRCTGHRGLRHATTSSTRSTCVPLDPKVHDRVNQLSAQSIQLSEGYLAKNANDVNALYARGVARGLKSTYMGMAEHAWFAALRSAIGARHDHERVLELDPNYVNAKNCRWESICT